MFLHEFEKRRGTEVAEVSIFLFPLLLQSPFFDTLPSTAMVVRGLDKFLSSTNLVNTDKLSMLKGSRIGIDGPHWLRRLLSKEKDKGQSEPLVMAMGGIPLGLKQAIEKELQGFKEAGITPYFVFNGLSTVRKDKPFSAPDKRPELRAEAWGLYQKEQVEAATAKWREQSM